MLVVYTLYRLVLLVTVAVAGALSYLAFGYADVNAQSSENNTQGFSIEESATPVKEADAKLSSRFVLNKDYTDPDNNCEFCTAMIYTPGQDEEAGIAYKDIRLDLEDSERIVFFARSDKPGQEVSFVAAGNDTTISSNNDTDIFPKIDFAITTENVTLQDKWKRFEIGLNSTELDDASYPFGVQLTADGSNQKQIFFLKGVTIDSTSAQNPLPTEFDTLNSTSTLVAAIDANSTNSSVPATIEFLANATGGVAPYSLSWNFGPGSNITDFGEKVSHTFDKPGYYNVTLAAKDSGTPSQDASATQLVTVGLAANKTNSELSDAAMPLTANIQANSTNSSVPATIEFLANATGGVAPYSLSWNFGPGSNITDFGEKVSHTFEKPGYYNVTLAAKDSGTPSQDASATQLVTVGLAANKTNSELSNISSTPTNSTFGSGTNVTAMGVETNSTVGSGTNVTAMGVETNSTVRSGTNVTAMGVDNADRDTLARNLGNLSTSSSAPNLLPKFRAHDAGQFVTAITDNITITANNTVAPNLSNHPPVAGDQILIVRSVRDGADIVLKASDQNDDPLTFDIVSNPSNGIIAGFDKQAGTLTYLPDSRSSGEDSFTFKVTDIHAAESNVARIFLTINPVIQRPLAISDVSAATDSDHPVSIILRASPSESGSGPLKFSIAVSPLHGKLSEVNRVGDDSATVTYFPNKEYSGNDVFKFNVDDLSAGTTASGKVSIKVIAVSPNEEQPLSTEMPANLDSSARNSRPVASGLTVQAEQDKRVSISLGGQDPDGDKVSFSVVASPSHGKLTTFDPSTGKVTYKPNSRFSGEDTFTFKLTDLNGKDSEIGRIFVLVRDSPNNHNSATSADSSSTKEDTDNQSKTREDLSNSYPQQRSPAKNQVLQVPTNAEIPINQHPSASAGPDRIVYERTYDVTLTGIGRDKDGDRLTYLWEQTAGNSVILSEVKTSKPKFNAPDVDGDKALAFKLTVTDGKGGQDTDYVKIKIKDKRDDNNQLLKGLSRDSTLRNQTSTFAN